MPTLEFSTPADVAPRIAQVRQAVVDSVKTMRLLLDNEPDALQALRILKFEEFGHHGDGVEVWSLLIEKVLGEHT